MLLATKTHRLILGVILLLLVDIIWVLSSELTKYLYENERFDKPFFCTYFKTSLFTLYLLLLGLLSPWKDACERNASYTLLDSPNVTTATTGNTGRPNPNSVGADGEEDSPDTVVATGGDAPSTSYHNNRKRKQHVSRLSDSTFVPIKLPEDNDGSDATTTGLLDAGVLRRVGQQETPLSMLHTGGQQPPIGPQPTPPPPPLPPMLRVIGAIDQPPVTNDDDDDGDSSDNTDNTDATTAGAVGVKSVRFNRLAEVREMSAHEAREALWARLSYAASQRLRRQRSNHRTARTALLFCVLWFAANYLFQLALEPGDVALVTLLSSSASSVFTLLLAAAFPSVAAGSIRGGGGGGGGDRLTLSKVCAVLTSCAGVALVTVAADGGPDEPRVLRGCVLALLSALCYAAYLVLVKRKGAAGCADGGSGDGRINIPLFFGFVGLWNLLLLWPVFFVLHFTQVEVFELPNRRQWTLLLLNGVVGTVLSEALWLWACFLTSSIIGTVAMTLQIPMSMLFDVWLKGKSFSLLFYAGSVPMCTSLIAVALLLGYDDSDPLYRFCRIVYRKVCHCRHPSTVRIVDLDDEQQESLIDSYEH